MPRQLVYWDSNAFLGLINKDTEPGHCAACEDVWVAAERGLILIVTSVFAVAEVIYMKGTPKLDPSKRGLVSNFFRAGHIVQKPVTRMIAEIARDIVWDLNIKPKDAIHVATAGYYKIGTFHTFDRGLLDLKTITINNFALVIREPYAPRQMEIPLQMKVSVPLPMGQTVNVPLVSQSVLPIEVPHEGKEPENGSEETTTDKQ